MALLWILVCFVLSAVAQGVEDIDAAPKVASDIKRRIVREDPVEQLLRPGETAGDPWRSTRKQNIPLKPNRADGIRKKSFLKRTFKKQEAPLHAGFRVVDDGAVHPITGKYMKNIKLHRIRGRTMALAGLAAGGAALGGKALYDRYKQKRSNTARMARAVSARRLI